MTREASLPAENHLAAEEAEAGRPPVGVAAPSQALPPVSSSETASVTGTATVATTPAAQQVPSKRRRLGTNATSPKAATPLEAVT